MVFGDQWETAGLRGVPSVSWTDPEIGENLERLREEETPREKPRELPRSTPKSVEENVREYASTLTEDLAKTLLQERLEEIEGLPKDTQTEILRKFQSWMEENGHLDTEIDLTIQASSIETWWGWVGRDIADAVYYQEDGE